MAELLMIQHVVPTRLRQQSFLRHGNWTVPNFERT